MSGTIPVTAWNQPDNWAAFVSWVECLTPVVPDHLRAGLAIRQRLAEQCTLIDQANIHVVASLEVAVALLHATPALFVLPWEEVIDDDDPSGTYSIASQTWMVFVVSRQVEDLIYGAAALSEAGMITTQVLRALQGFAPDGFGRGMRRRQAPRFGPYGGMADFEKGTGAIPLCFTLPIHSEGSINAY